ncbi:MAG TPA: glucose-1-phosphate adenylyltransferase [Anaerolineaceae bacterium]|nr:glucose-1-phosphate adenylyltransferase [Anaerolineaceae bacterium]
MPSENDILAVILGGGRGSRLYPLTKERSKPAVPMAGKYRLIDVPISNCINSNIFRIAVLTQFNSVSLHRHIASTYQFDAFHTGWVQIWAAEQTMSSADWYQGTADAVRKQLFEIRATRAPYVLILAGDHLYRMDYSAMARYHWESDADITVAVQPVAKKDTGRFGLLRRDTNLRLVDFAEKPKDPNVVELYASRDDPERPYIGSMGIYLFKTQVLLDLLENSDLEDFGKHIIPNAIPTHRVMGYDFEDYWEDIGTIRSFYETNLALARPNPPFNLFDPDAPIYTHARLLPGSTVQNTRMENVLIAEGCCIEQAEISNSVIGIRSQIAPGTVIRDSILMGNDYYNSAENRHSSGIAIGIGKNCRIEGAIIDKNPRFGDNITIRPFPQGTDIDTDLWVVRDGIVVIPKDTVLLPGTTIAPDVR